MIKMAKDFFKVTMLQKKRIKNCMLRYRLLAFLSYKLPFKNRLLHRITTRWAKMQNTGKDSCTAVYHVSCTCDPVKTGLCSSCSIFIDKTL